MKSEGNMDLKSIRLTRQWPHEVQGGVLLHRYLAAFSRTLPASENQPVAQLDGENHFTWTLGKATELPAALSAMLNSKKRGSIILPARTT